MPREERVVRRTSIECLMCSASSDNIQWRLATCFHIATYNTDRSRGDKGHCLKRPSTIRSSSCTDRCARIPNSRSPCTWNEVRLMDGKGPIIDFGRTQVICPGNARSEASQKWRPAALFDLVMPYRDHRADIFERWWCHDLAH